MLGIVLVLLKIKLPTFLMADLTYVGALTVPGSMFFIGIALLPLCTVTHDGACRLRPCPNFDETNLYFAILHAGHDQCACCCQTLRCGFRLRCYHGHRNNAAFDDRDPNRDDLHPVHSLGVAVE